MSHVKELEHAQKEIWHLHTQEGQTISTQSPCSADRDTYNTINIILSNPLACMQVFMLMLCDGMLILSTDKMQ